MDSPSGPAWTAGQVAKNLGISESTLRTWHRRYGLSPQDARPGHYRRYRAEDVARLRRMLELINLGMLASDAARAVQAGEPTAVPPARDVADLVEAAKALDTARCDLLLDRLFARRGVVDGWELVCRPALRGVDSHPRDDPVFIAAEHALSWALLGALHRLPRPPAAPGAALVLLACTDGEQHTLPLAALSAALAEHRVPSRMLGAATPGPSLERAVLETRPDVVVLWAQRPQTAAYGLLRALSRYPVRRVAAGLGWDSRRIEGVPQVSTLRAALAALLEGPQAALPLGSAGKAGRVSATRGRPLRYSQAYATPSRLARDGKAVAGPVEQGAGPERRRYIISKAGVAEVEKWLGEPVPPDPDLQSELFTKVVLALMLGRQANGYLDAQRAAH